MFLLYGCTCQCSHLRVHMHMSMFVARCPTRESQVSRIPKPAKGWGLDSTSSQIENLSHLEVRRAGTSMCLKSTECRPSRGMDCRIASCGMPLGGYKLACCSIMLQQSVNGEVCHCMAHLLSCVQRCRSALQHRCRTDEHRCRTDETRAQQRRHYHRRQ